MAKIIAKFAVTSLATGVLSLGFAVAIHAADSSVQNIDSHSVTTIVTTHKTEVNGSVATESNDSTNNSINQSSSQQTSDYSDDISSQKSADTGGSSAGNTTNLSVTGSSSNSANVTTVTSSANHTQALTGSGTNHPGDTNDLIASRLTDQKTAILAIPVTPQFQAQLQQKMSQSAAASSINHPEPTVSAVGLETASTNTSSNPNSPVPAKDLPIEGAMAGISDVLSNVTLPIRQLTAVLATATYLPIAIALVLVVSLLALVGVFAQRRFVDELKASGYSHAARADASDSIFSFATPLKSEFCLGHKPSQKLTFFGVRNKALTKDQHCWRISVSKPTLLALRTSVYALLRGSAFSGTASNIVNLNAI